MTDRPNDETPTNEQAGRVVAVQFSPAEAVVETGAVIFTLTRKADNPAAEPPEE
jgi:hypothetical protein